MDGDFGAALNEWHELFAAVAGVSGTLVGLLFVALGLNPRIMADDSPAGLRVWSGLTFHNFLALLAIGLAGLAPSDDGGTLAGTVTVLGVTGIYRVGRDFTRARTDPDPSWRGMSALLRFAAPAIAYVFCLVLAYGIWRQDADALNWFIPIMFLLTIGAASSCWDLLKAVGDIHREERAAD
jgi:hypothetical protein